MGIGGEKGPSESSQGKLERARAALLFDDLRVLRLGTMRSGKDFETRTLIWKVRDLGRYGLGDQSL